MHTKKRKKLVFSTMIALMLSSLPGAIHAQEQAASAAPAQEAAASSDKAVSSESASSAVQSDTNTPAVEEASSVEQGEAAAATGASAEASSTEQTGAATEAQAEVKDESAPAAEPTETTSTLVTVDKSGIAFEVGQAAALVDGQKQVLDKPVFISPVDSKAYASIDSIKQVFGKDVVWEPDNQRVVVKTQQPIELREAGKINPGFRIVDGTVYLPIRALGEQVFTDYVDYNNGVISITSANVSLENEVAQTVSGLLKP
ncbi:stalk domain-containing protein [Paenibacillus sp. y28]|uniref:stalk domain-containing protein n=1 Tax=Paenibacillus sp. y28 TaxID=3129110 RepID=UPI003016B88E